jgi:hypothetical protein
LRAQLYVTPTRLYALIRTAPEGSADRFFTTFTLNPQ